MSTKHWPSAWLAAACIATSGAAAAQVDCSKLNPDLRPRCEQVNRMNHACAGLVGEARSACERNNLDLPQREDCSKAPPPARAICEEHNRAIDKLTRCKGKTGPDLDACARANASRPGFRQL